jgi:hypothetical protein
LREIARIIAQACRAVQQGNAKKSGAATAPDVQNARKRINVATNLKPTRETSTSKIPLALGGGMGYTIFVLPPKVED